MKQIVFLNPEKTIQIIEDLFDGNHKDVIDVLKEDPLEQLTYIESLLEVKEAYILETIKNYSL